jgi:hypothetical protein
MGTPTKSADFRGQRAIYIHTHNSIHALIKNNENITFFNGFIKNKNFFYKIRKTWASTVIQPLKFLAKNRISQRAK